jgi:hypothetical protein
LVEQMFKAYYDDTKRTWERKSKERQNELNASVAIKLFNRVHHSA